jgi:hypothetical protein
MTDKDLADQLNELIVTLKATSLASAELSGTSETLTKVFKELSKESKASADLTKKQNEEKARLEKAKRKQEDNLKKAQEEAITSIKSFGKALISNDAGFNKYSEGVKSAGDAAWDVGKNFGPWGKIFGGAVKAASRAAAASFEQADNLLKASDSISKLGAVNSFSTSKLYEFAHGASLSSKEMDKLIKPMQSMQGGLTRLGSNVSEGVEKFAKMVNVSADVRSEFQRMGLNNEERIAAQGDFITQMERNGVLLNGRLKTDAGLQKASLDYVRELTALSGLTGQSKQTIQDQEAAARENMAYQMVQRKFDKELAAAKNDTERDAIEKRKASYEAYSSDLASTGNKALAEQAHIQYLTGVQSSIAVQGGINLAEAEKKVREGTFKRFDLSQKIQDKRDKEMDTNALGMVLNSDLAQQRMISETNNLVETAKITNKNMGKNQAELYEEEKRKVAANTDNKGGEAVTDPAQIARNNLTRAEEFAKLKFDDLVKTFNPLLGDLSLLKVATIALTAAAGILAVKLSSDAVKGGLGELVSGGKDLPAGANKKLIGNLGKSFALLAAFDVGYSFGKEVVGPYLDDLGQAMTGDKNDSFGTALYSWFHPEEAGKKYTADTPLPTAKSKPVATPPAATPPAATPPAASSPAASSPAASSPAASSPAASSDAGSAPAISTGSSGTGSFNYDTFAQALGKRESGGVYDKKNTIGYVGKYQFGAMALEDVNLVKPGTGRKGNSILNDPSVWNIDGGLTAFLQSPQIQESSMQKFTEMHRRQLQSMGVIAKNSPTPEVAGYLAVAHLLGPGGASNLKNGKNGSDAYGTSGSAYFLLGQRSQMPQAREGGIFSGSDSGFPVELHGNELVAPLDPNSILAKMLTASPSEAAAMMPASSAGSASSEMTQTLMDRFDTIINYLSEWVDIEQKILRQT